jgi:hypothetical protein
MKTKNMAVVLEVMVVFSVVFLFACENLLDKQEDIQKTTVTASAVINAPKGSAFFGSVKSIDDKIAQITAYHIFVSDPNGNMKYDEIKFLTEFPLTIDKLPIGETTFMITAFDNENKVLAKGNSVVTLIAGRNDIRVTLKWEQESDKNTPGDIVIENPTAEVVIGIEFEEIPEPPKYTNVFELDPSYHYVPGAYNFALSDDFHELDVYSENGFNTSRKVLVNRPYTYKSVEGPYNYHFYIFAPKDAELFLVVNGEADGKLLIDKAQDYGTYPYYIDYNFDTLEYIPAEELYCRLNFVVFQKGSVTFKIVMKIGQTLYSPYQSTYFVDQYYATFIGVAEDEVIYYGEWKPPVLSIPDGFHKVMGTADFANAEIYGDEKYLVYNPNDHYSFFASSMLYLIKVGQPYHHPPQHIGGGKSRTYQLLTNGNGDAVLNTRMYWDSGIVLGFDFIAYDTGSISFFGNWPSNYGYEHSFMFNCYAVDGFIIEGNSSVVSHGENTYKVALEGGPRKYINISFDYSAVSQTNGDRNRFAVIIRDSSGNVILDDNYSFSSPITTEASSRRPYSEYRKSFDVSQFESRLNGATIEIFQHAGDWSMSMGPAVYVWSNEPHYDIGG